MMVAVFGGDQPGASLMKNIKNPILSCAKDGAHVIGPLMSA
jgi:hypothetical protein